MTKIVYILGCLGFIGRHITKKCLDNGWAVMGIDKETYAADKASIELFKAYKNFTYQKADIRTLDKIYDCDFIINTAAETHVDNSIESSKEFLDTNVYGVVNILNLICRKQNYNRPIFFQFSTDEVYGDAKHDKFTEESVLFPSNPYSASKASADMIIQAWHRTYNIPYVILRPTNNYGIGQNPEKFIPRAIKYLTLNKKFPLYNNGNVSRTWLHVEDTTAALMHIIESGKYNTVFNINGTYHDSNLNVFKKILSEMGYNPETWKDFILPNTERPGHDLNYWLNDEKLRNLGWKNTQDFDAELKNIVKHYNTVFYW
jgi:dTDP-glucose 4,6-dehydratase